MDHIYRYQRYIYDLTRKHYLLGRDKLIAGLNPPQNGVVLEVGCGTARNLIKAAKRYPTCQFYGFDVSLVMLEEAKKSIARAKLQDRIQVAYGDATNFDGADAFGLAQYDRVFISYALTMIPPWRDVLKHVMTLVAEQGSVHVIDFGQQQDLPAWFRKMLFMWLRQFSVYPQAELKPELEKVTEQNDVSLTFQSLYRGYSDYAILQR
ncbi:MAG: class I SAM-dependent methyltransferase [Pseudomonadota bacterium]